MVVKQTPANVASKGACASKKRKAIPAKSTPQVQLSPSMAHNLLVEVIDDILNEPLDFGDIFRRNKLKLTLIHGQKRNKADAGVSLKTPASV